jgi:hypothetical protein
MKAAEINALEVVKELLLHPSINVNYVDKVCEFCP